MRLNILLAGLAAALTTTAVQAQTPDPAETPAPPPAASPAAEGEYAADLQKLISDAAGGTCSPELMGAQLLAACQSQIAAMSAGLASLGAVQSVTLIETNDTAQGKLETYRVVFAGGQTLNWTLGVKVDGKYETAYARS